MQTEVKRSSTDLSNKQVTGTKILGVASSLRRNSHSTRTLKILLEMATNKYDAQTHLLDLRKTKLPWYNPAIKPNESVENNNIQAASDTVKWADAFVLASPDYHGSM